MKILLTGATGLLGRAIFRELKVGEVLGLSWSRSAPKLRRCDLTDAAALNLVLEEFRPDFIIHAAAERRPDVCEKNPVASAALNLGSTAQLAAWAAANDSRLLFISTDYVFDGRTPPYAEDAKPNPLNAYGLGKLEGEKICLASSAGALVLRVPVLYGEVEKWGESSVLDVVPRLQAGETLSLDDWATRFPTYTGDVAVAIAALAKQLSADKDVPGGIYHFSGDEALSKYAMTRMIQTIGGFKSELLPVPSPPASAAPRPRNAQLSCGKLDKLLPDLRRSRFAAVLEKLPLSSK
jgi:dTDP-4-dehydrorhamnose reductase